jgi:hypothetical protein
MGARTNKPVRENPDGLFAGKLPTGNLSLTALLHPPLIKQADDIGANLPGIA